MPKLAGHLTRVYYDGYDFSGQLNALEVNGDADAPETSTFANVRKSFVVGLLEGKVVHRGLLTNEGSQAHDVLRSLLGSQDIFTATGGTLSGYPGVAGSASILARHNGRVDVKGVAAIEDEYVQDAPGLDFVTIVAPLAARGGTSAALDGGASSANGLRAYGQITAVALAGTPAIQHSATGTSAWADLISFGNQAARNAVAGSVTGTVERYLRANNDGTITWLLAAVRG